MLLVGGDFDRVRQSLLEDLDLSLLLGQFPRECVDSGLSRGTAHGIGDLFGLAVKRLP
jgi:hypothetical protein